MTEPTPPDIDPDTIDPAAALDDGPRQPPPLPELPALGSVPRDSAVATVQMAAQILDAVQTWAPLARDAMDWNGAVSTRRAVSSLSDLITRRALSKGAVLDAQHAVRIAERTVGQTVRAGQAAGLIRARGQGGPNVPALTTREVVGNGLDTVYRLADDVTDEQFDAAIETARDRGSCSFDHVFGALGIDKLSEVDKARRDKIVKYAAQGNSTRQIADLLDVSPERAGTLIRRYQVDVPADAAGIAAQLPDRAVNRRHAARSRAIDYTRVISEIISTLDGVAASARLVGPDAIDAVDPAQAADWSAALWDACVPILHMRKGLDNRGNK